MTAPARGPFRSTPTEAYYRARGYQTVKLRVPAQLVELWDAATEHSDAETRTEWITGALTAAAERELDGAGEAAKRSANTARSRR